MNKKLNLSLNIIFLALLVIFLTPKETSLGTTYNDNLEYNFEQINIIQYPLFTEPALLAVDEILNISIIITEEAILENLTLLSKYNSISVEFNEENISSTERLVSFTIDSSYVPGLYSIVLETSIGDDIEWNSVRVYETIPNNFTMVHLTDTHIGISGVTADEDLNYTVHRINEINPEFVILTGDVISGSYNYTLNLENIEIALKILSQLKMPVFIINGNHDLYNTSQWESYVNPRYQYSLNFGKYHFTFTSIYDVYSLPSSAVNWLKNDIAENENSTTIFCYHTDYADQFTNMGADFHLLGHEHKSSVTNMGSYLEIITGKAYYYRDEEPGAFRILDFVNGTLIGNTIETVMHPLPTIYYTNTETTESTNTQTSISSEMSSSSETSVDDSSEELSDITDTDNTDSGNKDNNYTNLENIETIAILSLSSVFVYRKKKN